MFIFSGNGRPGWRILSGLLFLAGCFWCPDLGQTQPVSTWMLHSILGRPSGRAAGEILSKTN